jgi:hypothetical protein
MKYLDESNIGCLLTETLAADVETILADETGFVCADAAVEVKCQQMPSISARYLILCDRSKVTYQARDPLP